MSISYTIAFFITGHGFGHAARAASIISEIHNQNPNIKFIIFSDIPAWFLYESTSIPLKIYHQKTDIGLVQKTPMEEDLPETIRELMKLIPFRSETISQLAKILNTSECSAVICDIAPLGIAAAKQAGIPSYLVENFTWDWIYEGYLSQEPSFAPFISILRQSFEQATYHIQTEPVCRPDRRADFIAPPVSRKPRLPKDHIRQRLGIPIGANMVLITMGGIAKMGIDIKNIPTDNSCFFVIPGGSQTQSCNQNVILIPHHSEFYHPDLIAASDIVVGKTGYSTLAEAYHAGIPYGYINRSTFRESPSLAHFIKTFMNGMEILWDDFRDGSWVRQLPDLISLPKIDRHSQNGAEKIARLVLDTLGDQHS